MITERIEYPKVPRWIGTEAGQWAWRELADWRGIAFDALSVQDRSRLLHEAETLWNNAHNRSLHVEELAQ